MREHASEAQSNKRNHSFKILEKHGLTREFLFLVKYTETRTCGHRSLHLAGGNMVAAQVTSKEFLRGSGRAQGFKSGRDAFFLLDFQFRFNLTLLRPNVPLSSMS
jgi:hypothetical protein